MSGEGKIAQPGPMVALYVLPTPDPNYVQLSYRTKATAYAGTQTVTIDEATRIFHRLLNVGNATEHPQWTPPEHLRT